MTLVKVICSVFFLSNSKLSTDQLLNYPVTCIDKNMQYHFLLSFLLEFSPFCLETHLIIKNNEKMYLP